jgi:SAM-dependent methyltransferase
MHPLNTPGIQWLRRSQWATQKIGSWIEAIQSGIFMGLIDDQSFRAFDIYPFDETQSLDITAETERGLEPWEHRITQEYLANAASLLVVAAEGGRELVGLNELGYATTGVAYGRELCEATRRELTLRRCGAAIQWCERFEVPRGEHPYDAAFIARKFFSYVHDRRCRIEMLANIRRTLRPDATLVLDFYTRDHDTLAFRMQAALANTLRKLRGQREFPVEVGDHLDPTTPLFHHHFVWEELRDELREAGFAPVAHETTWFGWCVARATRGNELREPSSHDNTEINETEQELAEVYG